MNNYVLLLVLMIFCHILDDYVLQSASLASLKQRKWWEENAPAEKYCYDYLVALLAHGFSWSIMISIPVFIYLKGQLDWVWFVVFFNALIHSYIDTLKANKFKLNLIEDQILHLIQILIIWAIAILK